MYSFKWLWGNHFSWTTIIKITIEGIYLVLTVYQSFWKSFLLCRSFCILTHRSLTQPLEVSAIAVHVWQRRRLSHTSVTGKNLSILTLRPLLLAAPSPLPCAMLSRITVFRWRPVSHSFLLVKDTWYSKPFQFAVTRCTKDFLAAQILDDSILFFSMAWRHLGIPHPARFRSWQYRAGCQQWWRQETQGVLGQPAPAKPGLCFRNMTFWFPDCRSLASFLCALQL